MKVGLVFPHQLVEQSALLDTCQSIYLVEEVLFFKKVNFHKAKIAFHRASMKFYEQYLSSCNVNVIYIDAQNDLSDVRKLIAHFVTQGTTSIDYLDPTDNYLERRITESSRTAGIELHKHPSPLFLNTKEEIFSFFKDRKRLFQTDFYKQQRTLRNVLMEMGKPVGGKWTFDDENRLKYPSKKIPPKTYFLSPNQFHLEAVAYTEKHFSTNYGQLNQDTYYPVSFAECKVWLTDFFATRFDEFGAYEDAIVAKELLLHHSLLSPLLNAGLLSTQFVIDEALDYADKHQIPINSLEGFIRQIMGWREFIRAVYELKGTEERTKNFWGFTRKIPPSFWNGTTGIEPIDTTIKKALETGYCHHIERLMIVGNFMLLCEFDPDEVYRWFMELFIDAYDWVMVPNVYGMSQFADGGLMATKPYISGSNYVLKMSDYKKGDWQATWDGLFWNFMHAHRSFFLQNPRLGMLVHTFDKMPQEKQTLHLTNAERYFNLLDGI